MTSIKSELTLDAGFAIQSMNYAYFLERKIPHQRIGVFMVGLSMLSAASENISHITGGQRFMIGLKHERMGPFLKYRTK